LDSKRVSLGFLSMEQKFSSKKMEHRSSGRREIVDIHTTKSRKKGLAGLFEGFVRTFRNFGFALILLPITLIALLCMGVSAVPGMYLYHIVDKATDGYPLFLMLVCKGLSLSAGYFLYGITLIFLVPLVNKILPLRLRPWRGNWYSLQTIPWYYHNALTYIVRFTFLDFVTPGPLNILFFRMMGMKIGKGVMINTTYISDPALITLEDFVTIGGSATIFAHYGQKGILILSPVVIKRGATIGLKASIMGDVVVGEGVVVPAHSALLPKTRVPDHAKFVVPAQQWKAPQHESSEDSSEADRSNETKDKESA